MAPPITQQGLPPLSTPFVNEDGTVNIVWYTFLRSLWLKSGLGPFIPAGTANRIGTVESQRRVVAAIIYPGGPNASTAIATDVAKYLNVYNIQTGQFEGRIKFTDEFP